MFQDQTSIHHPDQVLLDRSLYVNNDYWLAKPLVQSLQNSEIYHLAFRGTKYSVLFTSGESGSNLALLRLGAYIWLGRCGFINLGFLFKFAGVYMLAKSMPFHANNIMKSQDRLTYFRELCSTLFLLAVPVLVPLYMVHLPQWGRRRHHWQRCMDLLVMASVLGELILGRVAGLAEALPLLCPSLLSSAGWLQPIPAHLRAPAQPRGTLHHSWVLWSSPDPNPPINCINTSSPTKGRLQTMCFLHWKIEKEAVPESLIIFANKIVCKKSVTVSLEPILSPTGRGRWIVLTLMAPAFLWSTLLGWQNCSSVPGHAFLFCLQITLLSENAASTGAVKTNSVLQGFSPFLWPWW